MGFGKLQNASLCFQLVFYLPTLTTSKGNKCDDDFNDFAVRSKKLLKQLVQNNII